MDARLSGDLQRALARIPERQRAALLLAELHDLTGLELAAALGVSHVAARALLTRARESLRQALAAERAADAAAEADARRATRAAPPGSIDEPLPRASAAAPTTGLDATSAPAGRAAERLDGPLGLAEATWLDEHLAGCPACAAIAAAYEADRLAAPRACATTPPEPPRDLWARTAAAIEQAAARPSAPRPDAALDGRVPSVRCPASWSSRSWSASASCRAVPQPATAAQVPTVSPDWRAVGGGAGGQSPRRPIRARRRSRRRFAVDAGDVAWVDAGPGGFSLLAAEVDAVCPADGAAGCPTLRDTAARRRWPSTGTPQTIIAVADDAAGRRRIATSADAAARRRRRPAGRRRASPHRDHPTPPRPPTPPAESRPVARDEPPSTASRRPTVRRASRRRAVRRGHPSVEPSADRPSRPERQVPRRPPRPRWPSPAASRSSASRPRSPPTAVVRLHGPPRRRRRRPGRLRLARRRRGRARR